jgi:uncharacterized protein YbbK (DUF523 family)
VSDQRLRLPHDPEALAALREPTAADPLRVLVSGCLAGLPCGVSGTDYGLGAVLRELFALPALKMIPFCPEDSALGTPRTMPDIHGGDGHDVLAGRARVLDEHGQDLTEKMILGAQNMLAHARRERVELAMLTDMSAACGSQVISRGCRLVEKREFVASVGVAAALLIQNGIPVVSQRDPLTLGKIRALVDPSYTPDPGAADYHHSDWYRSYFGSAPEKPTR